MKDVLGIEPIVEKTEYLLINILELHHFRFSLTILLVGECFFEERRVVNNGVHMDFKFLGVWANDDFDELGVWFAAYNVRGQFFKIYLISCTHLKFRGFFFFGLGAERATVRDSAGDCAFAVA
jgi:hypothetical protein